MVKVLQAAAKLLQLQYAKYVVNIHPPQTLRAEVVMSRRRLLRDITTSAQKRVSYIKDTVIILNLGNYVSVVSR